MSAVFLPPASNCSWVVPSLVQILRVDFIQFWQRRIAKPNLQCWWYLIFVDIEIEATLIAPFGIPPPTAELEASVVTAVLVVLTNILLAIFLSPFIFLIPLNLIFLFLTIVKAYYITWDFMHMRDERTSLKRAVVWTFVFLALYIAVLFLTEADYIYEVYRTSTIKWNF